MSINRSLPTNLYTKEYYLDFCEGFQEFLDGSVSPRLIQVLEYGNIHEGMKVLDIGCGRGELTMMCAELGCDVWGIDYSEDAIAIAIDNLQNNWHPKITDRVTFERMNAKHLGFPKATFDRIFMTDVVEHLFPEELEQVLSEIKRVIKSGGRLVVHTAPNAWLIKPVYILAGLLFKWRKQGQHVNEQSYFSLYANLSQLNGLTEVQISKKPGFFKLGVGHQTSPKSLPGRIARVMDSILDSPVATALICHSPLKFILGTDLWATVDIPSGGKD